MNKNHQIVPLETNFFKIKLFWLSLLVVVLLLFTLIYLNDNNNYILSTVPLFQNSTTGNANQQIKTSNSSNIFNSLNFLYLVSILGSFLVSLMGIKLQKDKTINDFFTSIGVIKTHHLNGTIKLNDQITVEINWTNKGYFILKQDSEEITFAKSTEIYWKLLFLKQKLSVRNSLEITHVLTDK